VPHGAEAPAPGAPGLWQRQGGAKVMFCTHIEGCCCSKVVVTCKIRLSGHRDVGDPSGTANQIESRNEGYV